MDVGDTVPDFELPDQDGTARRLSDFLATGPVVLFFYPGANTPVCTAESCHFRDLKAEFDALGAQRVGISHDSVGKQKSFSNRFKFDYPLLSDSANQVATLFGVHRSSVLGTKRETFVIDTDRRVVGVVRSALRASLHADRALGFLRSRAGT